MGSQLQNDFFGTPTSCFVGSLLKLLSFSFFYRLAQVPLEYSGPSSWLREIVAA